MENQSYSYFKNYSGNYYICLQLSSGENELFEQNMEKHYSQHWQNKYKKFSCVILTMLYLICEAVPIKLRKLIVIPALLVWSTI